MKIKLIGVENPTGKWQDRRAVIIGELTAQVKIATGYVELTITQQELTKKLQKIFQEKEYEGTEGQDRDSYSDNQDRENYITNKTCPKCNSKNIENYITIPERKSTTIVAGCLDCGHKIKAGGTSIFDNPKRRKLK